MNGGNPNWSLDRGEKTDASLYYKKYRGDIKLFGYVRLFIFGPLSIATALKNSWPFVGAIFTI